MKTKRNTRSKRPQPAQQLKALFAVGGVAASLLAANFLAKQDEVQAETPTSAVVARERAAAANRYVDDAPLPQLVIPPAVTRSRSSG